MDAPSRVQSYLESLSGFQFVELDEPYGHIGATLTDAIFQAGINYTSVVLPRVERVHRHERAKSISGFLALLHE